MAERRDKRKYSDRSEYNQEWNRRRTQHLIASGLCLSNCGRKAVSGKRRCQICEGLAQQCVRRLKTNRRAQGLCPNCGDPALPNRARCLKHSTYTEEHRELKRKVFSYYGYQCTCCKETFAIEFLTLNHVNNDGAAHRRTFKGKIYNWVVSHNFPPILETHCWNCNGAKMVNGGICPHASSKQSISEAAHDTDNAI